MKTVKKSISSGPQTTPLINQTIGQAFDKTAAAFPHHAALISRHQNISWTYQQYQQQIEKFALGLLAVGINKGDRVGIWSPNRYEWCVTQFATAKIGAIMVCINPAYGLHELEYALNKVTCKAIVTAASFKQSHYLHMLYSLAPEIKSSIPGQLNSKRLPSLKTIIRMGDELSPGMYNFMDVNNKGSIKEQVILNELEKELSPDDAINIQFTSGTTGRPKGATLTHYNILNNGNIVGDGMKLHETDKLCLPVPLYHCFGMVMGNLACITHGASVVLPGEAFDPLITLQAIVDERCTALHGVPTMFISELELPQFNDFDLSSLRTGIMAGSACPAEIMKRVLHDMHMSEVLIAYGQTETSPVNHMTATDDPVDKRVGTVGKSGPHLDIKLIDNNGQTVSIGDKGELCCRGYSVMLNYWDDKDKTDDTIDKDGWLHSGDLATMDDKGYVEIVGRLKDMLIRGGENIYPREIEEFLYTHPGIQDVQIFGVKDDKWGEQVCAWIKPLPNALLNEDDIRSFCKGNIAHFKTPYYIRFVENFPMTVTGKIQKYKMREMMEQELNNDLELNNE